MSQFGNIMANYAYVTLITRASYLAGVIILAYSLRQQQSPHPLIVCYTKTLPQDCLRALELEAQDSNILLRAVEPLTPAAFSINDLIAERFADTWTKLRVFEPWQPQDHPDVDRLCYLDADMIVRRPMDTIFDIYLPGPDWLGASQACVCNVDKDAWAPQTWEAANCAHSVSSTFSIPTPVPKTTDTSSTLSAAQRETYAYFNSGMFLFQPSLFLWKSVEETFNSMTPDLVKAYKLPDQDFLNAFFRDRWLSVGWRFNAMKTLRYLHPNVWQDDDAVNVHYIVDKPWAGPRPQWFHGAKALDEKSGGYWSRTGFKGRDGETHSWWWAKWDSWSSHREATGQKAVVNLVQKHTYGGRAADVSDMQAIGARVQSFANSGPKINGKS